MQVCRCQCVGVLLSVCRCAGVSMWVCCCQCAGVLVSVCRCAGVLVSVCRCAGVLVSVCRCAGLLVLVCRCAGVPVYGVIGTDRTHTNLQYVRSLCEQLCREVLEEDIPDEPTRFADYLAIIAHQSPSGRYT